MISPELNYKELGQGHPIVILHGLFGTLDNWQTIAKYLSETYSVYLVDLRNHGRSPHLPDMNYGLMAEDVRQFMESHWLHEAYVMGHSMGGKVAMQLALNNPDMVEKLIVVDIAPKIYTGSHFEIFKALLSLDLAHTSDRAIAEAHLYQFEKDPGVVQFLMKNLSRKKEGGFEWKMNLPVIYQHYADILANVSGDHPFEHPTLFIRGELSGHVKDSDLPDIQRLFPAVVLETIPQAGHWVHADQPAALLERVRAFLG
jgi:pimeloyl-ACP methyl ester carboxylesterase